MVSEEHLGDSDTEKSSGPMNAQAKGPKETSSTLSRLWTFANSSFGIFLLSSVLLGLVSFSYTFWQTYESDRRAIEKLDLEIALRLGAIDRMGRAKDNVRYSNLVNVNDVIDGALKSSFYVRKPLFNEFEIKTSPR
jgi:hypothetical protein